MKTLEEIIKRYFEIENILEDRPDMNEHYYNKLEAKKEILKWVIGNED